MSDRESEVVWHVRLLAPASTAEVKIVVKVGEQELELHANATDARVRVVQERDCGHGRVCVLVPDAESIDGMRGSTPQP